MNSKNPNIFDGKDWLELQKQMMDTWLKSLDQVKTGRSGSTAGNPMTDGMEQWWKTVSASLPSGSQEFLNKLMEQGRIYFLLGEQFINLLNILKDVNKMTGEWQQALNDQIDQMKSLFIGAEGDSGKTMGVMGAWQQLPLDTLQRTFSFGSVMPGDFLQEMKPEHLEKVTDKFLSIPGVGYTRENQEQLQEGIRLWNEYQKISQEYNAAMNNISIKAFDAMRQKIIDMGARGEEITSLRQIYDLWVDCNEEAYSDYVFSDEYSELYGRLTNALMAVKHHGRNNIDEVLSALNMPTHRTMSTMQKRQQELRREQKHNSVLIETLEQEIAGLKQKLNPEMIKTSGQPVARKTRSAKTKKRKKTKVKTVAESASAGAGRKKKKKKKKKPATGKSGKIVIKI